MSELVDILVARDGIMDFEALELVKEARDQLQVYLEEGDLAGADNICQEYFGLEPDFLMELL